MGLAPFPGEPKTGQAIFPCGAWPTHQSISLKRFLWAWPVSRVNQLRSSAGKPKPEGLSPKGKALAHFFFAMKKMKRPKREIAPRPRNILNEAIKRVYGKIKGVVGGTMRED